MSALRDDPLFQESDLEQFTVTAQKALEQFRKSGQVLLENVGPIDTGNDLGANVIACLLSGSDLGGSFKVALVLEDSDVAGHNAWLTLFNRSPEDGPPFQTIDFRDIYSPETASIRASSLNSTSIIINRPPI